MGRLLVAFVAFPIAMGVVMLPWLDYVASKSVLLIASIIAGLEIAGMYVRINKTTLTISNKKNDIALKKEVESNTSRDGSFLEQKILLYIASIVGCMLLPSIILVHQYFLPLSLSHSYSFQGVLALILLSIILSSVLSLQKKYKIVYHTSSLFTYTLCYPGVFIAAMILIAGFESSPAHIFTIAFVVFSNDAMALVFGKLFSSDRNSRKKIRVHVSPTKSLVGFTAGFIAGYIAALISFFLFRDTYEPIIARYVVTIFFVNIGTILGDLYVSVYKRMSALKDTGYILPGKGGVLDTIDSLLFGASMYYIMMLSLFSTT